MTRMLDSQSVDALEAKLHGGVTRPADPDYDEVRALYNAMIDKKPALIARCADVDDVVAAVNFGRENELDIAIRGGGHNGGGLGSVDDGLMIDLSGLKDVEVDPNGRTVTIGGGCLLREVDAATAEHGLATPVGFIGSTGAGGLMLGGGIGHLTRGFGLSIDNITGAELVLADGSVVNADENENPDLYWAIRGGGGNFGVATKIRARLHPVSTVVAGPMLWPLDKAADVMRWYREFILDAPEELGGWFAFLSVPPAPPFPEELHLQKVAGIVWTWTGPEDGAEAAFAEARAQEGILVDGVAPVPLAAFNSAFDPIFTPGDQWYWRADFVKEVPDEAVEKHVEWAAKMPTWKSTMHLYPIDGAAHRVGPTDTPWGQREANFASVMVGVDPDPATADELREWAVGYQEALHPYSSGGAYLNMIMDEGQKLVEQSYADNYARLAKIKAQYDPGNLFHVNQNIRPAA
jgi:FAD binding domain/Berberine and berberine like